MIEQIQKDRQNLKEQTEEEPSFSYIPLLSTKPKTSFKLSKLSSINALYYAEESFKNGDKFFLKHIDKIRRELMGRPDIFESSLIFLQNKKIKDDLFYWIPGHKISNIFCFIAEINPNFIELYKSYYVRMIATGRMYYDALLFIKQRFQQEYHQFHLMSMDLEIFSRYENTAYSHPQVILNAEAYNILWPKDNVFSFSFLPGIELVNNSNIRDEAENVSKSLFITSSVISPLIWTGEETEGSDKCREILKILGIQETVEISEDLDGILVPKASFVDITVNGCNLVLSIEEFTNFLNGEDIFNVVSQV